VSTYNRRQTEAILLVRRHLAGLSGDEVSRLKQSMAPYLEFRDEVSSFQAENLAGVCTVRCFHDRTSACCGREGIFTFFADVVMNVLLSTGEQSDRLLETLDEDAGGPDCVYLGDTGCLWRLKPIICEMFLCGHARESVLEKNQPLAKRWEGLRRREKLFTLPDRPVLFDDLESFFLEAGMESPLMYFHRSPGLLRLKAKHGVCRK
jgi:hypothetical protein